MDFRVIINKILKKNEYYENGNIYTNWFRDFIWIDKFIEANSLNNNHKNIHFYGVNGKRKKRVYSEDVSIFYTGENIEKVHTYQKCILDKDNSLYSWFLNLNKNYSDYMLEDVDLALGFKDIRVANYIRFPYWITTLFPPEADYKKIKEIISIINNSNTLGLREAVCINRHDAFGTREKIYNDLHEVLEITCAGKWNNNTAELWSAYNNDKLKYMNLFKFNICPENMDAEDYCTEKIFDAFKAGCVPIYAGALNKPEPDIINYDRVIFWDLDGDNQEQIKFVDKLNKNDDLFYKFAKQPKLNDYAVEYVAERFELLRLKLKEILS